jgi:Tfp pilus assembly protein PilF
VWAAPSDAARYAACIGQAARDPAHAMETGFAWRIDGGGAAAHHCLAVAQMHAGHHGAALKSYDAAVAASVAAGDGQAVAILRQAAEAAMIADRPADAERFADTALAGPGGIEISGRARADLLLMRAEARVAQARTGPAMADLDAATAAAPDQALAWLLKATLARRGGDLVAAEAALLKAANLAPELPDVALEAGHLAAARGNTALARTAWEAAAADGAGTPAGAAAAQALGRLPALAGATNGVPPASPSPLLQEPR